ncbi:hypothetical protein [Serratia sp. M24T3]|uniref:hypothetical protein n=1 Tax=Serratia sp. M24T3 TaxID=932213 RepID=UPI00025BA80D|nr:hypothetical protein [Serratia sp. M24T3]EIC82169.1 hypothetical protein SPM24T3_23337 [Serratia sp. M24T3]
MINKTAIILTAVIMLMIALLMWAAFHYYGKSVSTADQLTTAVQQKKEAEFITQSQALSVGIFNTIAGATLNAQHANTLDSQATQADIKNALANDTCAVVAVPASAADRLLEHYNAIRKSAGNTNTGQPAGGLPAVPATK